MGLIKTAIRRANGAALPPTEEIERFGAEGEELICKLLFDSFDCVIRNAVVPYKDMFLEKDFAVLYKNRLVVLEVKNWKGEIGCEGDKFYQNKDNGVKKTLKSPVGTTNQFIRSFKRFYEINKGVYGAVVFVEPDCRLSLPREMEGIALLRPKELVSYIKGCARTEEAATEVIDPDRILRCTRLYSEDEEFCKGVLADTYLHLFTADGTEVRIDTTQLRYLTVKKQALRLQDKVYVTYINGANDVFYNRDAELTLGTLEGSYRRFALHKVRHVVF